MTPFSFLLFQLCGIFPFKISAHQKSIQNSKFWHFWAIAMHSIVILAAYKHFMMLLEQFSSADNQFFYIILARYQPVITLIEVILLSSQVVFKGLFITLKIYVQTIVKVSTSETYKLGNKATVIVLVFLCIFYILLFISYQELMFDSWNAALISGVYLTLISYSSIHFLHFYITLEIIIFKLMEQEKKLESLRSRSKYFKVNIKNNLMEGIDDILKVYNCFSRIYHFFVKVLTLRVFYDALLGIKFLEDTIQYFIETDNLYEIVNGILGMVYHLYGVPMLFMIIHQGHLIQTQVKIFEQVDGNLHSCLILSA